MRVPACLTLVIALLAGCSSDDAASVSSGTRACHSKADCGALDCQHITSSPTGLCVAHCANGACSVDAVCVESSSLGLAPSCIRSCTGSSGCAAGLACVEMASGIFGCFPSDWVQPTSADSGSKTCKDASECGGMDCATINGNTTGACVTRCSAWMCAAGQVCISGPTMGLDPSCLKQCTTSCPTGFTCAEYDPGQKACLPSSWL